MASQWFEEVPADFRAFRFCCPCTPELESTLIRAGVPDVTVKVNVSTSAPVVTITGVQCTGFASLLKWDTQSLSVCWPLFTRQETPSHKTWNKPFTGIAELWNSAMEKPSMFCGGFPSRKRRERAII